MSAKIFVFDLDKTLVYFDERARCSFYSRYYVREYALELLELLRQLNRQNMLILWTAATNPYVTDVLFRTNLGSHFKFVLTWEDCRTSKKQYGLKKSCDYILKFLENVYSEDECFALRNYKIVLIDDKATENGRDTYDCKIDIKPYDSDVVLKELRDPSFRDSELEALSGRFFDEVYAKYYDA